MGMRFEDVVERHRRLRLVALTRFARQQFIDAGYDGGQISVRPNWATDPGPARARGERERAFVFVGRLSPEKGVSTLIEAARAVNAPVEIIGSGPDETGLRASDLPANVELLGQRDRSFVLERMKAARAVVVPSNWFEGFPMVVVEAMSCGAPVVASDLGSLGEVVENGRTGLHFPPGDARALAGQLQRLADDDQLAYRLSVGARERYEAAYSEEAGLRSLLGLYEGEISAAAKARAGTEAA